jgi:hypothetical protein
MTHGRFPKAKMGVLPQGNDGARRWNLIFNILISLDPKNIFGFLFQEKSWQPKKKRRFINAKENPFCQDSGS